MWRIHYEHFHQENLEIDQSSENQQERSLCCPSCILLNLFLIFLHHRFLVKIQKCLNNFSNFEFSFTKAGSFLPKWFIVKDLKNLGFEIEINSIAYLKNSFNIHFSTNNIFDKIKIEHIFAPAASQKSLLCSVLGANVKKILFL